MFLEVIALSAEDVKCAQQAGANRIELVSAMAQDGLSPDLATIESVLAVATIPIRVMVRFHNRDFVYTAEETKQMCHWVKQVASLPVDGFVVGGLTAQNQIDVPFLQQIMDAAASKAITFHRAFDRLTDCVSGLDTLAALSINTVLTSGGLLHPINQNQPLLSQLQNQHPEIEILAGGGVNETTIAQFASSPITHFHVGSCVREAGQFDQPISAQRIQQLFTCYNKHHH